MCHGSRIEDGKSYENTMDPGVEKHMLEQRTKQTQVPVNHKYGNHKKHEGKIMQTV